MVEIIYVLYSFCPLLVKKKKIVSNSYKFHKVNCAIEEGYKRH